MVTVIDLATDQPAWGVRFEAGVRPMAIEANPDGSTKRIFVELSEFHGAAIVDFAMHKEVARIRLPDLPLRLENGHADEMTPCHGIAVAPDGRSLWINSVVDNAVFAYSLPDLRLLGYVSLPVREKSGQPPIGARPNWISFTPDSDRLFVSNSALDFSVGDRCSGDEAGCPRAGRQCAKAQQYSGVALARSGIGRNQTRSTGPQ